MEQYTLIIPAAGKGTRMGAKENKLFLPLKNIPIIIHTLKRFENDDLCKEVIMVINLQEKDIFNQLLEKYEIKKPIRFVEGGKERQESVYRGLKGHVATPFVLIHDGARPFVSQEVINRVYTTTKEQGATTCGVPVKDTIKRVENGQATQTIERSLLWSIQTPQGFSYKVLLDAHKEAEEKGYFGTDDASIIEESGQTVQVVMGDYQNIKVTTPEDLLVANAFLDAERK